MRNLCFLTLSFGLIVGCSKPEASVPKQAPQEPVAAVIQQQPLPPASISDEARAHVQRLLDQIMGGDESVKRELLGIHAVGLGKIESIGITSAVPRSRDGKVSESIVMVAVRIVGLDSIDGKKLDNNIQLLVMKNEGRWNVAGTTL